MIVTRLYFFGIETMTARLSNSAEEAERPSRLKEFM